MLAISSIFYKTKVSLLISVLNHISFYKIHPLGKYEFISSKEISKISMFFAEFIFPLKKISFTPLLQNVPYS